MQGAYLRPHSKAPHLMAASRLHDDSMAPVQCPHVNLPSLAPMFDQAT